MNLKLVGMKEWNPHIFSLFLLEHLKCQRGDGCLSILFIGLVSRFSYFNKPTQMTPGGLSLKLELLRNFRASLFYIFKVIEGFHCIKRVESAWAWVCEEKNMCIWYWTCANSAYTLHGINKYISYIEIEFVEFLYRVGFNRGGYLS